MRFLSLNRRVSVRLIAASSRFHISWRVSRVEDGYLHLSLFSAFLLHRDTTATRTGTRVFLRQGCPVSYASGTYYTYVYLYMDVHYSTFQKKARTLDPLCDLVFLLRA